MEQEKSFNEKEYLMFRIKDKYCSNPKLLKWITIIGATLAVLIAVVSLFSGRFLNEINNVVLFLMLAASNYLSLKFGNKIEPMTDPRELIGEYDRHNRRAWWVVPLIFVYLLFIVFLRQDIVMAAVVFGLTVVVIIAFLLLGLGKDNDIERLRELVNQEDNK